MAADPIRNMLTQGLPRTGALPFIPERMRDRSDRRLDRRAQMALSGPFLGTPLTAERDVHRALREAQPGPGSPDTWPGGTLRTKRTVGADGGSNGRHGASCFAPTHNRGALSARTGDTLGRPVVGVRLPGHVLQADLALRRLKATDGGLDLPHVMGLQQIVNLGGGCPRRRCAARPRRCARPARATPPPTAPRRPWCWVRAAR